jgi:predicted nucleic acid-binding protein
MAVYFFDSSALVKRHVHESGSAWVRSLTRVKTAHTLYIARITAVEITSAITRRQRAGSLSPAQAGAILGHFRRHLTQRYLILELTPSLLADAMLSARAHGLRAYDAVQLSAAIEVNRIYQTGGLGPVILVSADRDLNSAGAALGLAVDDPTTHP